MALYFHKIEGEMLYSGINMWASMCLASNTSKSGSVIASTSVNNQYHLHLFKLYSFNKHLGMYYSEDCTLHEYIKGQ